MTMIIVGVFATFGLLNGILYAANINLYEAEDPDNIRVSSDIETYGVSDGSWYSGSGVVKLGAKSNSASITWTNVSVPSTNNYILKFKYSHNSTEENPSPRPFSLSVNGQLITTFKGEKTGADIAPNWQEVTAVVPLHDGDNEIKISSEGEEGPEIDYLEVMSYSTIFEAETGAVAEHVDNTFGNNTANAPGFTGTGYVGVSANSNGYLQWNEVVVPEDGTYTLRLRYCLASASRPGTLTVNGEQTYGINGSPTGGWNIWNFEEISGVELSAGANVIQLKPAPGSSPLANYDRIEVYNDEAPHIGDQVFRTTTFETTDNDSTIAGTETGDVLVSPLLDGTRINNSSDTSVRIVEENDSRWAEVTVADSNPGIIGFPFHVSELTPPEMNSFTIEKTVMLKDKNAEYFFNLTNAEGSLKSPIYVISRDGHIYARSDDSASGAMAARAEWNVDEVIKIKTVFHIDTQSYEMFINDNQVVSNEPMQNASYMGGVKDFYLEVKEGPREESTILIDDVELSGSMATGSSAEVNPNPGKLYEEQPYIGEPMEYYVSPDGSDDNDGLSPDAPFKNIQHAADMTSPGDTVYVMPGTYSAQDNDDKFVDITRSGAYDPINEETHNITYTAYDLENKPKIFLPDDVKGVWDLVGVNANYIVIDGFEVEGNNNNITLTEAEANYDEKVLEGGADWSKYAMTNTNGISLDGHHIIVKNNHIHHVAGGGIGGGGDYITIENNHVHSNSWYTMYATSGISLINNVDFDNNTEDYKLVVKNNVVHNNETKVKWEKIEAYSDGNGIILDHSPDYDGRTLVVNNIVYENGGSGIHSYQAANVDVINNTLFNNSKSPHMNYANMFANASRNVNFLNNIVYEKEGKPVNDNINSINVNFANNLYYTGTDEDTGTVKVMGTNDRVFDPKFVSIEEGNYDFNLQESSPAIDYGTQTRAPELDFDGNQRPQGDNNKFDIGAYETPYTSDNPINDDVVVIPDPIDESEPIPDPDLDLDVIENMEAAKGTPEIDGVIDSIWDTTMSVETTKIYNTNLPSADATVRVLWDENNLYVLAEVNDSYLSNAATDSHNQDSIEFFLDQNNSKTSSYEEDDNQYRVSYAGLLSGTTDDYVAETSMVEGGYIVEAKLPLTSTTGEIGKTVGFDIQVNDTHDDSGTRHNTNKWSNLFEDSWKNTSKWGNLKMVEGEEEVSFANLSSLTEEYVLGNNGDKGKLKGILAKVNAAKKSDEKENIKARNNQLGAFINQVEAQTGKALTEAQADVLIDIANKLQE